MIQSNDPFSSYLEAQWRDMLPTNSALKRAVTISRQAGSGAKDIALKLANYLQNTPGKSSTPWMIFDRELVEEVLKEHHLPSSLAFLRPEDRVPRMEEMIEEVFGAFPPASHFVRQTAETILRMANHGNVIIIGRGANVVTSSIDHVLHVRLVGSLEKRIERIKTYEECDQKAALRFIHNADLGRRRYLRTYFHKDIEDPLLYHLTINTDLMTSQQAAKIIGDAVLNLKVATDQITSP